VAANVGNVQSQFLDGLVETNFNLGTIIVSLRLQAHGLNAMFLRHVGHAGARLVAVADEVAELHWMQRLVHLHGGRNRKQVWHTGFEHARHDCDIHRRAHGADHEEDVIDIEQLVGRFHCIGHLVLAVFDDEVDLAAVDAASGIGLVEAHALSIDRRHTPDREIAREIGVRADLDRVGRNAARHSIRRAVVRAPAAGQYKHRRHCYDS
jgi:plasmid replication initiation protein